MQNRNTAIALAAALVAGCAGLVAGCAGPAVDGRPAADSPALSIESEGATPYPASPDEPHLRNLRQLTHGGENAEAYFSADGQHLIFQATREGVAPCDQIFTMDLDGRNVKRVSSGEGRTTCAYYFPSGERILYSSTHHVDPACPAPPDMSRGYVWGLYDFDIFAANPDGSDLVQLTDAPGYDAEATISPDGSTIVFTSVRDGDLEIYTMDADGSNVKRLTNEPGYDGGPFFSPDGTKIVYRARHPESEEELHDYRTLLAAGLIRPGVLDIYVMNADGSNKQRVTDGDGASFAPFMHPNGRQILFSSNMHEPTGRNFDLYLVNVDGSGLERVTRHADFDGFPMFNRDGSVLVFASNRGAAREGDTNVFVADWVDTPADDKP